MGSSSIQSDLSGIRSAGLVSGLDTEALVKQMSALTKGKINRQEQMLTKLGWQQDSYREIIGKLDTFKSTYFDSLNKDTNLKSHYLMGAYKATCNNSKVNVTAGSNAAGIPYEISNIKQLAENASLTSEFGTGNTMVDGIRVEYKNSGGPYHIDVTLDGLTKTVEFSGSKQSLKEGLNYAFGVNTARKFELTDDAIRFNGGDTTTHSFSIKASESYFDDNGMEVAISIDNQVKALESMKISNGASNKITESMSLGDINFSEKLVGGSFNFSINGKDFSFTKDTSVKKMMDTINSDGKANVEMRFNSLSQKFTIKSKDPGGSSEINIVQKGGNLLTAILGPKQRVNGVTTGIDIGGSITSNSLKTNGIAGDSLTYDENGNPHMPNKLDFNDVKGGTFNVTVKNADGTTTTKEIGLWGYDVNGGKLDFTSAYDSDGRLTKAGAKTAMDSVNIQLKQAFGNNAPSFNFDGSSGRISLTAGNIADTVILETTNAVFEKGKLTQAEADKINEKSRALLDKMGMAHKASNEITEDSLVSDLLGSDYKEGSFSVDGHVVTLSRSTTIADLREMLGERGNVDLTRGIISIKGKVTANTEKGRAAVAVLMGEDYETIKNYTSSWERGVTTDSFKKPIAGAAVTNTDFSAMVGKGFDVVVKNYDGTTTTQTIRLPAENGDGVPYDYTGADGAKAAVDALNTQLGEAFTASNSKFSYDELTQKISFNSTRGDTLTINETAGDADSAAFLSQMGITTGSTTEITGNNTIKSVIPGITEGSFTVNGRNVTISETTTLGELVIALGTEGIVDLTHGTISINGKVEATDEAGKNAVANLMGQSYDEVKTTTAHVIKNGTASDKGQNCILTINGTEISNSSNDIVADGTTISIGNLSKDDIIKVNEGESIKTETVRDTSKGFEAVKKFVEDYNKLISELNSAISTRRPTTNGQITGDKYEPLTDEQREEMSDKEIEKWEEKAKVGMVYSDSTIAKVLSDLRSAINTRMGNNFSLHDMGITISTETSANGKLEIKDEAILKAAFDKYPDQIQELFTDLEGGLAANVEKVIDSAISTKKDSLGSLTQIAGIANTTTVAENRLSKQIMSYQSILSKLELSYKREQERYWNQFTVLEKTMNDLNTQGSWIQQQFGGQ